MKNERSVSGAFWKVIVSTFFIIGCAHVSIDSQKPIKLDVTMRLDIYQHVSQDADAIEGMISAPSGVQRQSWIGIGEMVAFAQEAGEYPQDVSEAIQRRKERRQELLDLEMERVLGESADGYVKVVPGKSVDGEASRLMSQENADRAKIYGFVAAKNGATSVDTAKVFGERILRDLPDGVMVQNALGVWSRKQG